VEGPRPIVDSGHAHHRARQRNVEEHLTTTRIAPRLLTLGAALVLAAAACSNGAGASTAPTSAAGGGMDKLVADAKAEGALNVIALPHDWCNYGAMIDGFKAKYAGITVNENLPDGGSGDEIEAIKTTKGQTGPAVPDVIDVGIAFGESIKTDKLVQPYKVSTWDTIDSKFKDPDGYWYGDYGSILTFEINKAVVTNSPADWADLLKPEYANKVALAGDPRVSSQAYNAVWAAALANGGSLDNAQPGLDFFKQLNTKGNLVPTIAKPGTIDQGATPITIRWAYNALAHKDTAAGNPEIDVVVPKTGRFLGVYIQAISASAPHVNAAKLWMEYLYSDEGQANWIKGYCNTTRLDDLKARGVSKDIIAKLPDITGAVYPTSAQATAAKTLITGQWDAAVGADIK
jgi:putative spermidine/putrescine transport system substrate-binding protein